MRTDVRRTPLGTEVKKEIALRGISTAALSRATGIPINRLRSRVDGGKDFQMEELAAVCRALGIAIADLLERTEVAA
jgi:DNA-binding Xre family transcriptional regulator